MVIVRQRLTMMSMVRFSKYVLLKANIITDLPPRPVAPRKSVKQEEDDSREEASFLLKLR